MVSARPLTEKRGRRFFCFSTKKKKKTRKERERGKSRLEATTTTLGGLFDKKSKKTLPPQNRCVCGKQHSQRERHSALFTKRTKKNRWIKEYTMAVNCVGDLAFLANSGNTNGKYRVSLLSYSTIDATVSGAFKFCEATTFFFLARRGIRIIGCACPGQREKPKGKHTQCAEVLARRRVLLPFHHLSVSFL